jgi:L-cysteine S-thiosulfotransferase
MNSPCGGLHGVEAWNSARRPRGHRDCRTWRAFFAAPLVLAAATLLAARAECQTPSAEAERSAGERAKLSGYHFATPETRRLQDNDDDNPAFLWVDIGRRIWRERQGTEGLSCADCHGPPESMRGIGAAYPKISRDTGRLFTLEHQINYCRTERMKAPPLAWETDEMLGLSALVMLQSRGLPVAVEVDGPAARYFEEGRRLYYLRRGQMNIACYHCHVLNSGNRLRADLLSQGHVNGYPLFRLGWQHMGSVHAMMKICYELVRATPEPHGSEELTSLQLYLAWRGNGLPVEAPAVRR